MVQTIYPNGLIPNYLQSPTLTVTSAAPTQNSVFRTGLATSLAPMTAIFIHRIIQNITPKGELADGEVSNYVYVLSEDIGADDAGAELTDVRSLFVGGQVHYFSEATEGAAISFHPLIVYLDLPIPIVTVAQQLNFLGSLVAHVVAAEPDVDMWLRLEYTIRAISRATQNRLIQRLNLATQP